MQLSRLSRFRVVLLSLVFVLGCSRIPSDFVTRLDAIRELDGRRRDLLVSRVKELSQEIKAESVPARREAMADELIARVVNIDFSAPSRQNTPGVVMQAYHSLLVGMSECLLEVVSAERILSGMLLGRARFERELPRVGTWTHACFPSLTDWGCPPETEEIVARLEAGDVEGTNASPRVQKILRSMSPDLRSRFPGIVSRMREDTSGGNRGYNYRKDIEGMRGDLERTIERKFLTAWDRTLSPSQSKALQAMFESAVGRKPEL